MEQQGLSVNRLAMRSWVEKGGPDCKARTVREDELHRPGNSDKQIEKIGDAITYLRESRQEILTEAALKKNTRDRIEDMMRFLDDQICAVTNQATKKEAKNSRKVDYFL